MVRSKIYVSRILRMDKINNYFLLRMNFVEDICRCSIWYLCVSHTVSPPLPWTSGVWFATSSLFHQPCVVHSTSLFFPQQELHYTFLLLHLVLRSLVAKLRIVAGMILRFFCQTFIIASNWYSLPFIICPIVTCKQSSISALFALLVCQ